MLADVVDPDSPLFGGSQSVRLVATRSDHPLQTILATIDRRSDTYWWEEVRGKHALRGTEARKIRDSSSPRHKGASGKARSAATPRAVLAGLPPSIPPASPPGDLGQGREIRRDTRLAEHLEGDRSDV